MELVLQTDGAARCIYGEELDLHLLGRLTVQRASLVEATENGQWTADLAPVGGPLLGPFARRSEALRAEEQWLLRGWLGASQ